jgi:hypothetical protein
LEKAPDVGPQSTIAQSAFRSSVRRTGAWPAILDRKEVDAMTNKAKTLFPLLAAAASLLVSSAVMAQARGGAFHGGGFHGGAFHGGGFNGGGFHGGGFHGGFVGHGVRNWGGYGYGGYGGGAYIVPGYPVEAYPDVCYQQIWADTPSGQKLEWVNTCANPF